MKKFNDTRLYFYGGIVLAVITVFIAIVTAHSALIVEPKVEKLLSSTENIDGNYKQAYLILRSPHLFAGYDHFDLEGIPVKNSLVFFDKLIYTGGEIDQAAKRYLEILLERRKLGTRLGTNSTAFFLLLTIITWGSYFYEKRRVRAVVA